MNIFFITVLLNVTLMGVVPPLGWLQDVNEFDNKEQCEEMIPVLGPMIFQQMMSYTYGLGNIEDIVCMTEEEWIDRNTALGHEAPENVGWKKKKSTLPEGT